MIKDIYSKTYQSTEFTLKIFYKIYPNLNSLLINNINPYSSNNYVRCNSKRCKTCPYANTLSTLNNSLNLTIIIPTKSSCHSINNIYILRCNKCNLYYIGETSRKISIRISEHLNQIKKFIKLKNTNQFINNTTNSSQYHIYKHFSDSNGYFIKVIFHFFRKKKKSCI